MKTLLRIIIYIMIVFSAGYIYLEFAVFQPQLREEAASKKRFDTANYMFKALCEKSGKKIHRTVKDVEGIFLMKLRPSGKNYGDQFRMDDPYGRDLGGDGYIESFLRGSYQANTTGTPAPGSPPRLGYHYVEAIDPVDGKRYHYTGKVEVVGQKDSNAPNIRSRLMKNPDYDLNNYGFVVRKVISSEARPRYGVTYDDISTHEEREYWIAGSSLRVVDLKTDEVIAERIGYMMDYAQGSRAVFRSPWLFAADNACPGFQSNPLRPIPRGRGSAAQARQTQDFVEKVLIPQKES